MRRSEERTLRSQAVSPAASVKPPNFRKSRLVILARAAFDFTISSLFAMHYMR